ncbi:MAG: LptF/LptG family permease, partial [bacterium]
MKNIKLLDKYILKQLIEAFLLGIVIFTSILFASDTFLYLVKQISAYGIPFKVAFLIIALKLPVILVLTIPMGVLLAAILTFNKLSSNSEITIMRACGISISRLALPVIIFGFAAGLLSFFTNEYIVPSANIQARNLTSWALTQRNIPKGKTNFSFKEMDSNNQIKRLFYVDNYNSKKLQGITVLDMSKKGALQIVQSKYGDVTPDYWNFEQGAMYTISRSGKILNTTVFDKLKLFANFSLLEKYKDNAAKELNFLDLLKYIKYQKQKGNKNLTSFIIKLQEKFAIPITCVLVALIGVPLAITPPRVRFNRGFLFSIMIIFCYYLIKSFSISLGEAQILNPFIS